MPKRIRSFASESSKRISCNTSIPGENTMHTQRTKSTLILATVATFVLMNSSANAGLVGHWKFDEGSGTTAADSSTSGFDADQTIVAGSWIAGKSGGAYNAPRFSLDATESNSMNLVGGSVTVSAWVTARTGSSFQGIVGFEGTQSAGDIYGFKMDNNDRVNWTTIGTSPQISTDTLANYASATNDGWVHLVGVYDGNTGTSTLYVNGSSDGSVAKAGGIPDKTPPSTFNIGRYYNTGSFAFTGSIDDVQVYDEALSAGDVTFLFNNPGSALGSAANTAPEPSTLVLVGFGVVGLVGGRRRRNR